MATVYNVMLYGGLILAIIFAIIAIVLFVVLKVPKAIGIVTGSTERKSVEEIREKGYESVQGMGASKKDAIKNHTSKISVRDVESSAAVKKEKKGRANYEKAIADLQNAKKGDMRELTDEEATNVLRYDEDGEEATDVLRYDEDGEEATDVLRYDEDGEEATDVLRYDEDGEEATDVLRYDEDGEEATDVLRTDDEEATDVLRTDDEEATDVLRADDEEATDVLRADDEEATDVLRVGDDEEATDVLKVDAQGEEKVRGAHSGAVKMIMDVVVVHSEEKI